MRKFIAVGFLFYIWMLLLTTNAQISSIPTRSTISQAYQTIAEEGSNLTQRNKLNFIGSTIACVDNAGATRTDCTISGTGLTTWKLDDVATGSPRSVANMVTGTGILLSQSDTGSQINTTVAVDTASLEYLATTYFDIGACQNTTASVITDTFTSNAPTAACLTGTQTQGVAVFANSGTTEIRLKFQLPPNHKTGSTQNKISLKWTSSTTSGNMKWFVQTAFASSGESINPSFNTAQNVVTAAPGTTSYYVDSEISNLTMTGEAANDMMFIRIYRDKSDGADTLSGTVSLAGVNISRRNTLQ